MAGDDVILFDPLFEDDIGRQAARFLEGRLHVMLTVFWHARSTAALAAARPGTRVWTSTRAAAAVRRRAPVTDVFRPGDELPGGIVALPTARGSEVVYWIEAQRAVIAGDVLLVDDGQLCLCPQTWLGGKTHAHLAETLAPLLELPVEIVVTSHGGPVLHDARRALAEALDRAAASG